MSWKSLFSGLVACTSPHISAQPEKQIKMAKDSNSFFLVFHFPGRKKTGFPVAPSFLELCNKSGITFPSIGKKILRTSPATESMKLPTITSRPLNVAKSNLTYYFTLSKQNSINLYFDPAQATPEPTRVSWAQAMMGRMEGMRKTLAMQDTR